MNKKRYFCFFEQSGTFRDVLRSYGHEAYDYDIQNEYGKTDFQIDLFKEIETAFDKLSGIGGGYSIFDDMNPKTDFILAFFPCTMFTDLNELIFRGYNGGNKKQDISAKNIRQILKRNITRAYFYELWIKFCFVVSELKVPAIIENPKGNNCRNYVKLYSPWQPAFDEPDRTRYGDKFKKPTHFFAINFEMKENFIMYDKEYFNILTVLNSGLKGKERSEMTPRYADNFYKRFLAHLEPA